MPLPFSAHHKNAQAKADWRARVVPLLREGLTLPPANRFALRVTLYASWDGPDGTPDPKMPDWDRLVTPIQDAVAEALGINDRCIRRALVEQINSVDSYAVVEITSCGVL